MPYNRTDRLTEAAKCLDRAATIMASDGSDYLFGFHHHLADLADECRHTADQLTA